MMTAQICILVRNCSGKKREKGLLKSSTSKVDVLQGTLLMYLGVDHDHPKSQQHHVLECIEDNVEVQCLNEDFFFISNDEYDLLMTVATCHDRYTIYLNKQWLEEGLTLKANDYVDVYDKAQAKDLTGILRYKGKVDGVSGIYFGVELPYNPGHGSCNGTFRQQRFFTCEPESAVFVGLHRIRKAKGPPRKQSLDPAASNLYKEYGLRVGDRIVWVSDEGPEPGVVKWIGRLADARSKDEITVGVEFDRPVGSGTGKYKDQRLFHARQNHASLVPILGLMKELEFLNDMKPAAGNDNDMALAAFQEAEGFGGKTQAEVIEEQRRIMEECNMASPRQPSIENKQAASKPHKKAVNPPYEFNRSRNEYLADDLGKVPAEENHKPEPPPPVQSNTARNKAVTPHDPELGVGSLVEVMSNKPLYGVIKWIGELKDQKEPRKLIAGLEMEEEIAAGTDGRFGSEQIFTCPPRKGFFVPLYKCRKDKRFQDQYLGRSASQDRSINFGSTETPDLEGTVSPPNSLEDISLVCGKGKGIQGHHNSCYMDATLLAMFYFTTVFDSILHRTKNVHDLPEYGEVQQVLKEGIVNPLRRHHYVRADKIMKLRKLLDKVGKIPGMMSEEKDPEEFLNLLLNEITRAEPFLRICSEDSKDVQHTYFYQLIMDKDEKLVLPTTQQLFELSFLQIGIKLKEEPSCLIIQMPRFGKDYKMYRRIKPCLELDITDVLENVPRECIICGDLAVFECKECYQVHGAGLNTIAFCDGCKKTSHQHKARINHKCRQISVPHVFREKYARQKQSGQQTVPIPRVKMELFAVICIQTSHYVSFVKTGRGNWAKWIFFDSMADRMGEQSGYNIPEVKECNEIPHWLSDEYHNDIIKITEDKTLPEHMRRLFCDAYICMYQSPDVMMFQ